MQLILSKWGATLRFRKGMFVLTVRDEDDISFPLSKVRSIVLMPGTRVTTDALLAAVSNQISVHVMKRNGEIVGMVWSAHYGSIATIRVNQAQFVESEGGREWIKQQIIERIRGQQGHLSYLRRRRSRFRELLEEAIAKLEEYLDAIEGLPVNPSERFRNRLRGHEGSASRFYFQTLAKIVPEEYAFEGRVRPYATDKFNVTLNYLLGILYGRVEKALIEAGVDPYMGIYHRNQFNRPVLTFDFIEPFRVWAETVVTSACLERLLTDDMYRWDQVTLRKDQSPREVLYLDVKGKRLMVQAFTDYLNQVTDWRGRRRSRDAHIRLAAQDFAQLLKRWEG